MSEHPVRIGVAGGRGVAGERFAERGVAEAGGGAGGRVEQQVGGAEVVGQGQQGARNAAAGGRVDDGEQAADAACALCGVTAGGLADEVGAPDVFEAADRAEGVGDVLADGVPVVVEVGVGLVGDPVAGLRGSWKVVREVRRRMAS